MIKTIGVIGAGQMGSGIAHVCALAGLDVKIADLTGERLTKAIDAIGHNINPRRSTRSGATSPARSRAARSRRRTSRRR